MDLSIIPQLFIAPAPSTSFHCRVSIALTSLKLSLFLLAFDADEESFFATPCSLIYAEYFSYELELFSLT